MEKLFRLDYIKTKDFISCSLDESEYKKFWLYAKMFCEVETFETKEDLFQKIYNKYKWNDLRFNFYKKIFDDFLLELENTYIFNNIKSTKFMTKWKKLELAISLFDFYNYIDDFYD